MNFGTGNWRNNKNEDRHANLKMTGELALGKQTSNYNSNGMIKNDQYSNYNSKTNQDRDPFGAIQNTNQPRGGIGINYRPPSQEDELSQAQNSLRLLKAKMSTRKQQSPPPETFDQSPNDFGFGSNNDINKPFPGNQQKNVYKQSSNGNSMSSNSNNAKSNYRKQFIPSFDNQDEEQEPIEDKQFQINDRQRQGNKSNSIKKQQPTYQSEQNDDPYEQPVKSYQYNQKQQKPVQNGNTLKSSSPYSRQRPSQQTTEEDNYGYEKPQMNQKGNLPPRVRGGIGGTQDNKISNYDNPFNSQQQQYEGNSRQMKNNNNNKQQQSNKNDYQNEHDQELAKATGQKKLPDEYAEEEGEMIECPEGCGRSFNEKALEKHIKVCKSVFQSKRKAFNSQQARVIDKEQVKITRQQKTKDSHEQKKGLSGQDRQIGGSKKAKWKAQSEAFRAMLKQTSGQQITQEEQQAFNDMATNDLIQCQHCGRKFNEKAAQKHIPFCASKQQLDNIKKGGKKVQTNGKKW